MRQDRAKAAAIAAHVVLLVLVKNLGQCCRAPPQLVVTV
jgi:hypothetical protein